MMHLPPPMWCCGAARCITPACSACSACSGPRCRCCWPDPPSVCRKTGIALFALAGVAGAISAPIAGRVADRGWTRPATAGRDAADHGRLCADAWRSISARPCRWWCSPLPRSRSISACRPMSCSAFAALFALGGEFAQPPERALYDDVLPGRRAGLGDRRLGLRQWRLAHVADSESALPLLSLIYLATEPKQAPHA